MEYVTKRLEWAPYMRSLSCSPGILGLLQQAIWSQRQQQDWQVGPSSRVTFFPWREVHLRGGGRAGDDVKFHWPVKTRRGDLCAQSSTNSSGSVSQRGEEGPSQIHAASRKRSQRFCLLISVALGSLRGRISEIVFGPLARAWALLFYLT